MSANPITLSNARVYHEAGSFAIIRHSASGADSTEPADIYTPGKNVIVSRKNGYQASTTDLADGNSIFPAATYVTGASGTVALVTNTFDPDLLSFLRGGKREELTDAKVPVVNLDFTIGADGKIDLSGYGTAIDAASPLTVRAAYDNADFEKAETATEGKFAVSADAPELTFADADKGKVVYVTCTMTMASVVHYSVPRIPKNSVYTLLLFGKDKDFGGGDVSHCVTIYDSVVPDGEISGPTAQLTPESATYNFKMIAPRAGAQAIDEYRWTDSAESDAT